MRGVREWQGDVYYLLWIAALTLQEADKQATPPAALLEDAYLELEVDLVVLGRVRLALDIAAVDALHEDRRGRALLLLTHDDSKGLARGEELRAPEEEGLGDRGGHRARPALARWRLLRLMLLGVRGAEEA